jgi:hypothetical protein
MTSRLLLSLVPSGANGLPFVTFLPMLEALTTRLMSFPPIDAFRDTGLLLRDGCALSVGSGARGILLVVGEWELAFRPGR